MSKFGAPGPIEARPRAAKITDRTGNWPVVAGQLVELSTGQRRKTAYVFRVEGGRAWVSTLQASSGRWATPRWAECSDVVGPAADPGTRPAGAA